MGDLSVWYMYVDSRPAPSVVTTTDYTHVTWQASVESGLWTMTPGKMHTITFLQVYKTDSNVTTELPKTEEVCAYVCGFLSCRILQ